MKDRSLDELFLKCLQGKANEQEYETAYKWINSDKSNYEYYKEIRDSWVAAGIVTNHSEYNCNKAWRRIARRTGIQMISVPRINSGMRNIAAIFIFAFVLGVLGYHFLYSRNDVFIERDFIVEAPLGSKTFLMLPDSTSVWLNAGSTLRYSTHYDITGRTVHLTGEAYFNVEPGGKLPFQVYAKDLVISALGTEFNVKAYPDEELVETTIVSGLVSLERTAPDGDIEKILLRPSQRAYSATGDSIIGVIGMPDKTAEEVDKVIEGIDSEILSLVRPLDKLTVEKDVNIEVYTSWKDNRMVFEREKMADLAVKLERIYDVKIIFKDSELKEYHLSGSLEQETLVQLLDAVRLAIPLDYSFENDKIVLSMNHELKEKYNLTSSNMQLTINH